MENIVQSLKVRCTEAGTNISEVCRRAGVARSTVDRWEDKLPNTFRILQKLEQANQEIATEKQTESQN